jgi:tRNA-specific 2-thiouridylase
VRCNGIVRFDKMLDLATAIGATTLATGHYASITNDTHGPLLTASAEPRKDQTYMLARLDPASLDRIWFPLGEATDKAHIRELAKRAKLSVADKPDSQDLCFLAGVGKDNLLKRQGLEKVPGQIVDTQGTVLGHHDGQQAFTVGQRRGLKLQNPAPLYVIRKDANRVVVGAKEDLEATAVRLAPAELYREADTVNAVRLRYRSAPVACRAQQSEDGLVLKLSEPFSGVAPGQTACLLDDDTVIGWGVIAGSSATVPIPLPLATKAHA